jgi:dTDP-glucose 4,6-dehydratase
MKIVITGVHGFIGSHFAFHALKHWPEAEVVGLARKSAEKNTRRLDNLWFDKPLASRFHLYYSDMRDSNLTEVLEGATHVVNFAAKTFVDHSVRDPQPFIDSNITGTYNLLEAVRKTSSIEHFIQFSTDEVYGPAGETAHTEDSPLNPTNPYSATKAAGDMLALSYASSYKLPLLLTRTENNYGYYQHPQKVIPAWVKLALEDKPLIVYGDGLHQRMWLRVEDTCSALEILINDKAQGIYNIAGDQELNNLELADIVLTTLLKDPKNIRFIDESVIRPSHDRRYAIDASKLRSHGWSPAWTPQRGIIDAVQWYVKNSWWL